MYVITVVQQVSEYFVDKGLEYCYGICQTIGHQQVLIVPLRGVEGCFLLIFVLDLHQLVDTAHV